MKLKIQSLGNGTGRPVNPNYLFENQSEEDEENYHEAVSNLRHRKFEEANPALPLYLNNEPYMGSDVVEGERVWQAYDGFGPLRDNCWFDCRHPHEDYEALGIDTLEIYRITHSAPDNDKKVAEVRVINKQLNFKSQVVTYENGLLRTFKKGDVFPAKTVFNNEETKQLRDFLNSLPL